MPPPYIHIVHQVSGGLALAPRMLLAASLMQTCLHVHAAGKRQQQGQHPNWRSRATMQSSRRRSGGKCSGSQSRSGWWDLSA